MNPFGGLWDKVARAAYNLSKLLNGMRMMVFSVQSGVTGDFFFGKDTKGTPGPASEGDTQRDTEYGPLTIQNCCGP
jgi:hypothetical protein